MFIRFQGKIPLAGTSSREGIFQLAFALCDEPSTPRYAVDELERNLSWLKTHLKSPLILEYDENFRAIAWFKPEAEEPLKRIWAIRAMLEDFGYHIDVVKSNNPGNIIYEDGWQVIAKPWRNAAW